MEIEAHAELSGGNSASSQSKPGEKLFSELIVRAALWVVSHPMGYLS